MQPLYGAVIGESGFQIPIREAERHVRGDHGGESTATSYRALHHHQRAVCYAPRQLYVGHGQAVAINAALIMAAAGDVRIALTIAA